MKIAGSNKSRTYPNRLDKRYRNNLIFPNVKPKFKLDFLTGSPVFTIGSCFARNIEEALVSLGISLPTKKFIAPKSEWPARPNGLLNEYNPGSISQKIIMTLEGKHSPVETIFPHKDQYYDLLLCGGAAVTYDRSIERRKEIFDVYSNLLLSEIVIITLGFIEVWFDQETNCYLNRKPIFEAQNRNRFIFRRLDVFDAMPLLEKALEALTSLGKYIILTLSPVPLAATFTNQDCVIANEFSKSVLKVCIERLCRKFNNVDYFPSYEIVRSVGLSGYEKDNIHVVDDVVTEITKYMIDIYHESSVKI